MKIDDEYARNLRWLLKRIEQAKAKGELRSIVIYVTQSGDANSECLLSHLKGRLRLESKKALFFRVPLSEVEAVVWRKRGLWMQLEFEVAKRNYHLRFVAPESLETTSSYAPKNWFGELAPIFMFNTMRLFAKSRELGEANFAESEKWRAVFRDAPFPNTNAKS